MNAAVEGPTALDPQEAEGGPLVRGMAVADMTAMRIAFRLVIALVGCPAACATVPVGRPPSVGEIATINGEAARGRGLAVEPPLVVESGAGCGSISSEL